jgi:hypothetical protein
MSSFVTCIQSSETESFRALIIHHEQFKDDETLSHIKRVLLYYTEHVVTTSDIHDVSHFTHLVIIDPNDLLANERKQQLLESFPGTVIELGIPSTIVDEKAKSETTLLEISLPYNHRYLPISPVKGVLEIVSKVEFNSVVVGRNYMKQDVPLLVEKDGVYHLLVEQVTEELVPIIIEGLRNEFRYRSVQSTQYHITIIDVHPLVDTDHLRELIHLLVENETPFSVAVMPKIVRENDQKTLFLTDNQELIDLLQELQSKGHPILVQETLTNEPSYPIEELVEKLVKATIFPIGVYVGDQPLSFHERELVSKYASTIIADIQPESLLLGSQFFQSAQVKGHQGVVFPLIRLPFEQDLIQFRHQWIALLRSLSILPDQQLAIVVPAFESTEKLTIIQDVMEKEEGQWVDLLDFVHRLEVEGISIFRTHKGYQVKDEIPFLSALKRNVSFSLFEKILWGLVLFVFISIVLFASHSWRLRLKRRQLLFKEKRVH